MAPLDRVKILFQTNNPAFIKYVGKILTYSECKGSFRGMAKGIQEIWHTENFAGLYRGHTATLARIFPYAAIKFMAYEQYKEVLYFKSTYSV